MKPGEFMGMDGQLCRAHLHYSTEHSSGWWFPSPSALHPDDPDFPAAVAALQALIRPKQAVPLAGVHPGVGLRWCGEEEAFGWVGAGTSRQYLYRFLDGQVEYLGECGEWIHFGVDMDAIFNAGRRYERERG